MRTAEQVAADNALDEAIRRCADAYSLADDEVITAWVVAAATQGDDEERTGYFALHPGGTQPGYVAAGLLSFALEHTLHMPDDD